MLKDKDVLLDNLTTTTTTTRPTTTTITTTTIKYYYIPDCKPQLGEPDAKNPEAQQERQPHKERENVKKNKQQ